MAYSTWRYIQGEWNLADGFRKSYKNKSKRQKEKPEVREVMDDLDAKTAEVHRTIMDGTYEVGEYRHYVLHDRKKARNISVLPFVDRGVQNMIKDAIEPILVNQFTDDMCAGIPHRGISARKKRWSVISKMRKAMADKKNKWCILMDIHHCYDTINNVVVARELEKHITDKRTLELVKKHLFTQKYLAIGDPISHLYCNLIVSRIVRRLKEEGKCRCLVNFADNIAIFGDSKEEVVRLSKLAKQESARQRLRFNKSYPFEIDKVGVVNFCGRKYTRSKVTLRNDTKIRYIKARHKSRSMPSYNGIIISCNARNLRKQVENKDNTMHEKQRTPFAGRNIKTEQLVGVKHTIVAKQKKSSKQKDNETYYDVQAIAVGYGLVRYTTGSKLLCMFLDKEEIPIRDVVIQKDWRGFFYEGSIYSNDEEADIIRREFGIDY